MPISSCPSCEIAMEVQHYEDVLIDICPSCRGVWLDRGEMQKVIALVRRQEAEAPSGDFRAAAEPARRFDSHRDTRDEYGHRDSRDEYGHRDIPDEYRHRGRRKRSLWDLLEEVID